MYFFMLNHLRKGHKLIGHSFGRNLHKSNMAATVSHGKCICGPCVYRNILFGGVIVYDHTNHSKYKEMTKKDFDRNFVEKQNGRHCEIWFLCS